MSAFTFADEPSIAFVYVVLIDTSSICGAVLSMLICGISADLSALLPAQSLSMNFNSVFLISSASVFM